MHDARICYIGDGRTESSDKTDSCPRIDFPTLAESTSQSVSDSSRRAGRSHSRNFNALNGYDRTTEFFQVGEEFTPNRLLRTTAFSGVRLKVVDGFRLTHSVAEAAGAARMRIALQLICLWAALAQVAAAQSTKDIPRPLRDWISRDSKKNADGLSPEKERLPPLRRIADPQNLKSKVPSIKAAAEIKEQEDLKCQKIKALRYLASVGCGCYNEDGKITEALLASMTDCTEEVRLATMEVIQFTAQQAPCQHCNQKSCCNEEIVKKLADIAYGMDDKGCPKEPSARVRAGACKAMKACCPNQAQYTPVPTKPLVEPEGIESTPPATESGPPMPPEEQRVPGPTAEADQPGEWRIQASTVVPISIPSSEPGRELVTTANDEGVTHADSVAKPMGRIEQVMTRQEALVLMFENQAPTFESRLIVYHRHALGRISASCELDIVAIDGMKVMARPTAGAVALSKVAVGDLVIAR
jgi:hypothetical protein